MGCSNFSRETLINNATIALHNESLTIRESPLSCLEISCGLQKVAKILRVYNFSSPQPITRPPPVWIVSKVGKSDNKLSCDLRSLVKIITRWQGALLYLQRTNMCGWRDYVNSTPTHTHSELLLQKGWGVYWGTSAAQLMFYYLSPWKERERERPAPCIFSKCQSPRPACRAPWICFKRTSCAYRIISGINHKRTKVSTNFIRPLFPGHRGT